jgi:flagellar biosynthesis protein FlhF
VSSTGKLVAEDANDEKLAPLSNVLRHFHNNLTRNEVEPEFSLKLIEKVNDILLGDDNTLDAAAALSSVVSAELGKPETLRMRTDKKPTVAIFIGPTGVGKTTTLAKIAADCALNKNLKVGMITADTYRIAAVQQLRTYAEILGIPYRLCTHRPKCVG